MQYFPIFSGDPTLLTYLTRTLQEASCTIREKEGRYYLSSSDIDTLKSSSTLTPDANGLRTALLLLDSKYNTLELPRKIELCVDGILILLNGCIKLKYKNVSGLTRNSLMTPSTTESGIAFETDDKGQTRYRATPYVAVRLILVAGNDFYQEADAKSPNLKDLWLLARHDEVVAEALFYYAYQRQIGIPELYKIYEVMSKDVGGTEALQKLTEDRLKNFTGWADNSYLSGEKARHPLGKSYPEQRSGNPPMDLNIAIELIHNLLWEWIRTTRLK